MRGSPAILAALLPAALLLAAAAEARPGGPATVGALFWHDSPNDRRALEGVREGFRLAGIDAEFLVESARGDGEVPEETRGLRRADLAGRILPGWRARGADLLYALGTEAALALREVERDLPVVFTAVTNPVGSGIAPDWDGSGTNLCGNSNWIEAYETLEVFRAAVPDLARLGVVYNGENPVSIEEVAGARRFFAENRLKRLKLFEQWIDGPEGIEAAVAKVLDQGAQALWVPIDYDVYRNLDRVVAVTRPRGVPVVSSQSSAVGNGAVAGIAVDYRMLGLKSVVLARRILRDGADPGSLPVGRMNSYRVLVDLGEARRIGFDVPLGLLATADDILGGER